MNCEIIILNFGRIGLSDEFVFCLAPFLTKQVINKWHLLLLLRMPDILIDLIILANACLNIHYAAIFLQLLREYNHVNPQDDEEGKIFLNSRVSFLLFSHKDIESFKE